MNPNGDRHLCAGCGRPIQDKYLLKAMDVYWHENCLKCGCCNCKLGDAGQTLYTKKNLLLCKTDYIRLFGNSGLCTACNKLIPAFEMVMRAKNNVYHLECFACQQCSHRFCVGDRYYLCNNKILCEDDYHHHQQLYNMERRLPSRPIAGSGLFHDKENICGGSNGGGIGGAGGGGGGGVAGGGGIGGIGVGMNVGGSASDGLAHLKNEIIVN